MGLCLKFYSLTATMTAECNIKIGVILKIDPNETKNGSLCLYNKRNIFYNVKRIKHNIGSCCLKNN